MPLTPGHPRYRFVRFLIVGVSNTVISYVVFIVLITLLKDVAVKGAIAQALGYSAGILWSFVFNRWWTFGSQGNVLTQGGTFVVSQLFVLAFSTLALSGLVDYAGGPPTPCWIAVTGVTTITNYLLQKHLVFRQHAGGPES